MLNNELQLFVFEGSRAESKYVEQLERNFLGKRISVKCKRANCAYKDSCEDVEACLAEPHYKQFSASDCRQDLCNINKYTNDVWQELIFAHVAKMNYLVNDVFVFPEKTESQSTIFDKQIEKHVNHKCPMVAVLSAFPIYVLDYFGVETLKKKLEKVLSGKS